jgi:large subunit ribosomal protein L9
MANTKLILTHEVGGLGEPGDVVEVKNGYARNYLVPRGFAIGWSRGGEKQIEQIRKGRKVREVRDLGHANEIKAELEGLRVRLATRAGATGRLFGGVTVADIASAVKASGGPDVDKRKIEMGNAIKTVGTHTVSVRLHPEVAAKVEITVVAG